MQHMQQHTRPTLRMADGGMFGAVKSLFSSAPPETMTQKFARQDAERAAKAGVAPPPVAAPAPSRGLLDTGSLYNAGSMTNQRMKVAGLRDGGDLRTGHGGHVPGSGTGDKIPAKYEPGEFVVSNDMLDEAPQLREQLHSLRNNVLAHKGMTPEQADAKALGEQGLRAAVGFDPGIDFQAFDTKPKDRFAQTGGGYKMPAVNPATGGYTGSPTGAPNGQTTGTQNFTTNTAQAGGLRQGNQPSVMGGGNVGGPNSSAPLQQPGGNNGVPRPESLKRTLLRDAFGSKVAWAGSTGGVKDSLAKSGYQPSPVVEGPAKPAGALSRLGGGLVKLGAGAGALYSGAGAIKDASDGNYSDAAIGAVDTAANLAVATGSPAAVPAGIYLGAKGITSAVNNSLSDNAKDTIGGTINQGVRSLGKTFGQDWGVDDSAYLAQKAEASLRNPQPTAPRTAAQPSPQAAVNPAQPAANSQPAAANPEQALRADPFAGQIKRVGNSYSGTNIGADAGMVDGQGKSMTPRGFVGIVPGAGTQAPQTNAPAVEQGGVNYGDGSGQPSLGWQARMDRKNAETGASSIFNTESRRTARASLQAMDAQELAGTNNRSAQVVAKMQLDSQGKIASMHNTTALRGQDVTREGHILSNDVAKANARYQVGKDKRDYETNRSDYANTRGDKNFEKRQQATKDLHAEIGNMLPPGADGKPDLANAAKYATGLTAHVAGVADQYRKRAAAEPNNPQAKDWLDTAAHLDSQGPASLDATAKQRLMAGMMAKDAETSSHSNLNPFGGTAVQTNAPVTSLKLKPGVFSDDYVSTHSDGSQGKIPRRTIDGGWFEPANRQYDSLKVK